MLFYRVTMTPNEEKLTDDMISHLVHTSINTNDTLENSGIYVCENGCDTVQLAVIIGDGQNVQKIIEDFVRDVRTSDYAFHYEETTMGQAMSMIEESNYESMYGSESEIRAKFNIANFENRMYHWYGENLIKSMKLEEIEETLRTCGVGKTMRPELERIRICGGVKFRGHPVQYLINTDSNKSRREICRTLLSTLYSKGRLTSKRYSYINFDRLDVEMIEDEVDELYRVSNGGAVIIRINESDLQKSSGTFMLRKICSDLIKPYGGTVLTLLCIPTGCDDAEKIAREIVGTAGFVKLCEQRYDIKQAKIVLIKEAERVAATVDEGLFKELYSDKESTNCAGQKAYLLPGENSEKEWTYKELKGIFEAWYALRLRENNFIQYTRGIDGNTDVLADDNNDTCGALGQGTNSGRGPGRNPNRPMTAMEEIDEMIGIEDAKKVIRQIVDFESARKKFSSGNRSWNRTSMHMVFTGNPGTAKTTVARLVAKALKENGVLANGTFVEAGRADLVAGYVGHTAKCVKSKFEEAKGGVLFIDEAYSLLDDRTGSFGDEAINTIVQEMENNRNDVVVIFAGYKDEIKKFLDRNPGLESRINYHVSFDDYSVDELMEISRYIANKNGLSLAPSAETELHLIYEKAHHDINFGNGRFVRNTIEKALVNHGCKLAQLESVDDDTINTITGEDIAEVSRTLAEGSKPAMNQIGFMAS